MKKSERTAIRILEAAVQAIATVGVERASITEIAGRANVSRGLVAHYFPRKEELFPRVIEHIARAGYEAIAQPRPDLPPDQQLLFTLAENFRFWFDNPLYFKCFFLFYYYSAIDSEYRRTNTSITEKTISRFEEYLREDERLRGLNSAPATLRQRAQSFHRELLGQVEHWFIVEQSVDADAYIAAAMASFQRRLDAGV